MGFGDKFKDLAKQAQDAVAERKDQIAEAVDRASVVADQRTGGKYSDKIAKVGQKAHGVVEKVAGEPGAGEPDPSATGEPPASGQQPVGEPTAPPPAHAGAEPPDFA